MLIALTSYKHDSDRQVILVNPDYIVMVNETHSGTEIFTHDGQSFMVRESPEFIQEATAGQQATG